VDVHPRLLPAGTGSLFIVDVEASGKTPMSGLMTEFAVVHLLSGASFYGSLYQTHPHPENAAVPVVEVDAAGRPITQPSWLVASPAETTSAQCTRLAEVAERLAAWLDGFALPRLTLVSDNNGYDAMWLNCFTDEQLGRVLFGHSSRRIGDFYAGTRGRWNDQSSWKRLRRTRHTHHPLDDAEELSIPVDRRVSGDLRSGLLIAV